MLNTFNIRIIIGFHLIYDYVETIKIVLSSSVYDRRTTYCIKDNFYFSLQFYFSGLVNVVFLDSLIYPKIS